MSSTDSNSSAKNNNNNNNNNSTSQHIFQKVNDGFHSLRGSPSELWKTYFLKFLDSFAYFSLSLIFTLFLSEDFNYTDVEAGTIYGAWGALITIYGLLTGVVMDRLGVAMSLRVGFVISLVSRIWMFLTTSRWVLLFNVLFLLPLGNCLGIPVLTIGIRRYTKKSNRGFAFGLFYVIMNVAALISGPLVDFCTIYFKSDDSSNESQTRQLRQLADDDALTWSFSGYRAIILAGIIANIVACMVTFTVREIKVLEHKDEDDEDGDENDNNHYNNSDNQDDDNNNNNNTPSEKNSSSAQVAFVPTQSSALENLKETTRSKNFWRFLFVCIITLNVRMIFRHLDATLPKYMVREFGDSVAKGTIYSINPFLIIILVPLVTAATTNVDPLMMIHVGSYVSALSVFSLAISTSIESAVVFVILLSIGEAIWSPRLYDYTMTMVKEGREGTFMALSSAPLFLAKLPVGFMSGYLLQKYCPEEGERNSQMMWAIIGFVTLSSPVLMTIFWKFISNRSEDDDDAACCAKETEIVSLTENIDCEDSKSQHFSDDLESLHEKRHNDLREIS